uniref:Putative retrotransposon protein n=1 Tax=Phyllostachys edulis TaxID=38705 RepID=D3IVE8_PHYED|nr:putative retrotransposon protein [Phyllostachys edulis]
MAMVVVVRVFTGGAISQTGSSVDFGGMEATVLLFRESPDLTTLVNRIKWKFGWDDPGVVVGMQGRHDAELGSKMHVFLVPIVSADDWDMYKEIVLASQVRVLEVAVERTIVVEDLPDNLDVVNGNTEEQDPAAHHSRAPMEERPSEEFSAEEGRVLRSVMGEVPSVHSFDDVSMVDKAVCANGLRSRDGIADPENDIIQKNLLFSTMEDMKVVQPGPTRSGSDEAEEDEEEAGEDEEEGGADEAEEAEEKAGEDEEDVAARIPDEMLLKDLVDAPPPTQPTQDTPPRRRKRRDRADISSVNVIEGTRGQHPVARFKPGSGARRKRN